jgi:hypothetical protein
MPDPSWPVPPEDWEFWTVVDPRRVASSGLVGDVLAGLPVGSRAVSAIDAVDAVDTGDALGAVGPAGPGGARRFEPRPPRLGAPPRSVVAAYGTDRGTWLARLRASERVAQPGVAPTTTVEATPVPENETLPAPAAPVTPPRPAARPAPEDAWAVDGLRFPVSRVDV